MGSSLKRKELFNSSIIKLMIAFQVLNSGQVSGWLLPGRLSCYVPRYFFVWLWKYSSVKNLERELSFKLLKSDSFDVRKKDSRLKEELKLIWKSQVCLIWTRLNILLKDWPVFLLYFTVGWRSVLEYPSSFWLACESFEM